MPVWCWLTIDFWEQGVYTFFQLSNIKVLKRSMFVYHPHLVVLYEDSSLKP